MNRPTRPVPPSFRTRLGLLLFAGLPFFAAAATGDGSAPVTAGNRGPGDSAAPAAQPVTVEAGYTAEVRAIVAGGRQRGLVYRGLADAVVKCDLAAAAGAPADTLLQLSALVPQGGDLSGAWLGDLQTSSNIQAYNHPALYELWLGGKAGGGRFAWRVGRLLADADFATTDGGGVFFNSSFGWPAFISANTVNTGPAFYRTALGGYARVAVTETVSLHGGIYDGDTFDDPAGDPALHPNGLHLALGHGQGMFAIGEIVLERTAGAGVTGLPGKVKLGVWHHSAAFPDLFDPTRSHPGNQGWYLAAEQTLWREVGAKGGAGRALSGFARAGFSRGDRNLLSAAWDAGFNLSGPISGRAADVLGLGVASARISENFRRAERAARQPVISDHETVVEGSYKFVVRPNWSVAPNVQWILHPGGSTALPDALVLGLRSRVTF